MNSSVLITLLHLLSNVDFPVVDNFYVKNLQIIAKYQTLDLKFVLGVGSFSALFCHSLECDKGEGVRG